jgi:outer membrane protein TolC
MKKIKSYLNPFCINTFLTFFIVLLVYVFLFKAVHAENPPASSLGAIIDEALKNNPQIQAAKSRSEAAKARVRLLRSLEDPRFEYEYDKITADMDAVMNGKTAPMRTFAISQEIPFPTKLFLRKQAAQKEANSFGQEYKETERRVIKEVKEAYFQLFLSHKKIAVTKENLSLLAQFVEIANKKYSVGKAGQQDALRAQVEYSKLSNQLVLLDQEEEISKSMLNALLNRSQDTLIDIAQETNNKNLILSEEKVISLAKESRPELKSFKEFVKKSKVDLSLAEQEYLPNFMVKYKREEKNGSAGAWAGMLGVSIPLWFFDKQDSFVKEAKANVEVAKAEYQATENMVLFESRSAYAKFEAAKKLIKIYETGVLPQAQAALETARLSYQADKIDLLQLLDSQRTLRDFQIEYFEALANSEIALADLERAVGADLSK